METAAFIERVIYLSLWSRTGRSIANEEKSWAYNFACDIFNNLIDIEGTRLAFNYTDVFTSLNTHQAGFSYIDTTKAATTQGFLEVDSVVGQFNSQNYALNYLNVTNFLENFNIVGSGQIPLVWTWLGDIKGIGIYPSGNVTQFLVTGKKKTSPLTVSYNAVSGQYTFSPTTLDFGGETNYYNYLIYKVAQEMCIESNSPFSQEKEKKLIELEARLKNNSVANISFNKKGAELTFGYGLHGR